jgi:hypothetical protein
MQRANASFCQRAPCKSHSHYGSPGFLVTNNAGLTRDESYLPTDRSLPAETRRYVAILALILTGPRIDGSVVVSSNALSRPLAPLFAARADGEPEDVPPAARSPKLAPCCCQRIARGTAVRWLVRTHLRADRLQWR